VSRKAKNSLDGFFIPLWFTSSSCASKNLSIFERSVAYLLLWFIKQIQQRVTLIIGLSKRVQVHIASASMLGLGIFSIPLFFLGVMGGFFVSEPLLPSIPPFL
jgi:hypothetical protein